DLGPRSRCQPNPRANRHRVAPCAAQADEQRIRPISAIITQDLGVLAVVAAEQVEVAIVVDVQERDAESDERQRGKADGSCLSTIRPSAGASQLLTYLEHPATLATIVAKDPRSIRGYETGSREFRSKPEARVASVRPVERALTRNTATRAERRTSSMRRRGARRSSER